MAKTYVTFGTNHVHRIGEKIFDKDCIAVINCNSAEEGRTKAFEYFGPQFCFEHYEIEWIPDLKWYPRGFIEV